MVDGYTGWQCRWRQAAQKVNGAIEEAPVSTSINSIPSEEQEALNRERTPDDLPDVVKEALVAQEAALAAGMGCPQFDENGLEVF